MNVTRKTVINRRAAHKKMVAKKKMMTKVNATLALMSTTSVLGHFAQPQVKVIAVEDVKTNFLNKIVNSAKQIAASSDLYASVMIAQAVLESAWGQSKLAQAPNYNLFGIKGKYNGNSVNFDTLEDDGSGNYYTINDGFRKYNNYGESLNDYANLLTGNNDPSDWRYNFYKGARVSTTSSYQDATAYLTGRYATDTSYGSKLNSIIASNNLTQYDVVKTGATSSATTATASPTAIPTAQNQATSSYTIKAGDSLYRIALAHGMSVADLKALNGLTGDMIYVGAQLKLPATTTNHQPTVVSEKPQVAKPATPTVSVEKTGTTTTTNSYTIKAGDTLYAIAKRYGVSVNTLLAANNGSANIYPGQQLNFNVTTVATTNQKETTLKQVASTPAPQTSEQANRSATVTPAPTASGAGTYTVKAGDTLYAIARRTGVSVQSLIAANNGSTMIFPGQKLAVTQVTNTAATVTTATQPVSSSTTTQNQAPAKPVVTNSNVQPANSQVSGSTYRVQAGDTLYAIARRTGVSVQSLIAANNGSTMIYVGQTLNLGGASVNTAPATTTQANQASAVTSATVPTASTPVVNTPSPTNTATAASSGATYIVQAGDTLYAIARRNGLDVNQLIAANGGSTNIRIGQSISLK